MKILRWTFCLVVAAAGLVCFDRPATAGDAQETFDKRFAADIERVEQTPDVSDDAELGAIMLNTADGNPGDTPQFTLLCDSVYKLGAKTPRGYPVAIKAMRLLANNVPKHREKALGKILVLQMKLYKSASRRDKIATGQDTVYTLLKLSDARAHSGDAVGARSFLRQGRKIATTIKSDTLLRQLKNREKTLPARVRTGLKLQKQLAGLKSDLGNIELRSKLIGQLVSRGDLVEARSLLTPEVDELLQSYVPLTLNNPRSLPADVAREMAQWYHSLLNDAPDEIRETLLVRIRRYLNVYLMKHTENDIQRLTGAGEFHDVELQLVKLGRFPGGKYWSLNVVALGLIADAKTNTAIEKAQKYLWNLQRNDGTWPGRLDNHDQSARYATAMITFALIQSGVDPLDKRLERTLKTLAATETDDTVSLAMRCCLWSTINQQQPGKYATELRADALKLVRGNIDGGFGPVCSPDSDSRYHDARHTRLAISGAALAAQGGVKISHRFWIRSMNWWRSSQNSDGGWGRTPVGRSRGNSTAGGAVSILICLDQLGRSRKNAMNHDSLKKAFRWLDGHLDNGKNRDQMSYLYTISRLGVACGKKKIGNVDWFKWASDDLLERQKPDGAWKSRKTPEHISTALGILTLSVARGGR